MSLSVIDVNKTYMVTCNDVEFESTKDVLISYNARIYNTFDAIKIYCIEIIDSDLLILKQDHPELEIYKNEDIGLVQPIK